MKFNQMIALLLILVVALGGGIFGGIALLGQGSTGADDIPTTGSGTLSSCPKDVGTTVTTTLYNILNTSGSDDRDQTAYLYKVVGGEEALVDSITDTTAGTNVLDCGETYRARLVSASGESALITGIRVGEGATLATDGSYVEFTTKSLSYNLQIESKAMSGLKVKAYDNVNAGFMYDSADDSSTDYETTGATFMSTVDNTTALAIGTGEALDVSLSLRSVTAYTDVADFGIYVLLDAAVTVFDTPNVVFEGARLTEVTLVGPESKAYSSYEFVYMIDAPTEGALIPYNSDRDLDVEIAALSDVNPAAGDDVVIAIAPIGGVKEISGNNVRVSSVTDAASPSAVHTIQSFTMDIA